MDDSSAKKKKAPAAKKTTKASGSGDKPAKAPAKPRANSKKKEGNSSMNGKTLYDPPSSHSKEFSMRIFH
ncbi:unnamed protein product [Anisakis simplex]|uniref:HMG box domain-containing protein n=1 Tax=Anisakis simplex TaxID=6269 RepID=A0A0M3JJ22_ANISI|nr:unnamed protein product [Anisakis simplex]